jgi:hypothetical protein
VPVVDAAEVAVAVRGELAALLLLLRWGDAAGPPPALVRACEAALTADETDGDLAAAELL